MKNKRGQFYLMAAAIIIAAVIGLSSKGYIKTASSTRIYDLGKDLKIETGHVIDYGTYQSKDNAELIMNWTQKFKNYAEMQGERTSDWVFVYGNETNVYAYKFITASIGSVNIDIDETSIPIIDLKDSRPLIRSSVRTSTGLIEVKFDDYTYTFNLSGGQNFYFVIKSEKQVVTA